MNNIHVEAKLLTICELTVVYRELYLNFYLSLITY